MLQPGEYHYIITVKAAKSARAGKETTVTSSRLVTFEHEMTDAEAFNVVFDNMKVEIANKHNWKLDTMLMLVLFFSLNPN